MSNLLQTSPYLTCIAAGDASPIVYAVDEKAPVTPNLTPPTGAAFAVIGLDRSVVWHPDVEALAALQRAARAPVSRAALVEIYGPALISELVAREWLKHPEDLCKDYLLTTAQIEVTAHCNWGCTFCPVSVDRKPSATMPMPLFEEIVQKISPYDTIRYVTFHFYNEPTLDRHFEERLTVLQQYGLRLRLFTNASQLTERKIEKLKETGVLYQLVANIPALREPAFRAITGSRTHARSVRHLDAAIAAGLPVDIVVNGSGEELRRNLQELRETYEPRGVAVNSTLVSDRAGTLVEDYHQSVRIEGPLTGCAWPVNHAHFSVRGDMFICCNDYHQREVFGNITAGSVHDIMTSPAAIRLRRRVFGIDEAPQDYLCRSCHDQLPDFPRRQFTPLAIFPINAVRKREGVEHD